MQENEVKRETTKNWILRNSHYIYLYACNIYSNVVLSPFFISFLSVRFFSLSLSCFRYIVFTFVQSSRFLPFLSYVTALVLLLLLVLLLWVFALLLLLLQLLIHSFAFWSICLCVLDSLVRPVQIPARKVRCKIARNLSLFS